MPLHRDIHWIGRQWAVTGHGMQLIDQKLQGFFDIEVSKLWDDVLVDSMHAKDWLNPADFEKALALARARYPQPAGAVASPSEVTRPSAIKPVAPIPEVARPIAPKPETPKAIPRAETPRAEPPKREKPNPIEPPRSATDGAKASAVESVRIEPKPKAPNPGQRDPIEPPHAVAGVQMPAVATPAPVEPPGPPPTLFRMRYEGRARFVRAWRVVARKF